MVIEDISLRSAAALFPPPPAMPAVVPDMRVGFILSPRFSFLAFASFVDGLRHAADEADFSRQIYCHWKIVAPTPDPVVASCGVAVLPQQSFPDPRDFDHLVVVGGLLPSCLAHPPETLAYLRQAHAANVAVVGLCTGSFVLAKAGLLDGRRCAVDATHLNQMKGLFPAVEATSDQIYVNERGHPHLPRRHHDPGSRHRPHRGALRPGAGDQGGHGPADGSAPRRPSHAPAPLRAPDGERQSQAGAGRGLHGKSTSPGRSASRRCPCRSASRRASWAGCSASTPAARPRRSGATCAWNTATGCC